MRAANSRLARRIALQFSLDFADVNRALNRAAGARNVEQATLEQLHDRLRAAQ